MKRILFFLVVMLLCIGAGVAQDAPQTKAGGKPIEKAADAKLPPHATFTSEESARLRVKLLRVEKARIELAQLQTRIAQLQPQIETDGDALGVAFRETAAKHGIPAEALPQFDVINGGSDSDRPILLKKKPEQKADVKPDAKPETPKP